MNVAVLLTRKLGIYLFAVMVAYVLAVVTASQHVVSSLASMGVEVGLADRRAPRSSSRPLSRNRSVSRIAWP